MSSMADGLRELHRLHLKLQSVLDQLDRGPRQIKARQKATQKKQELVVEHQELLKQLRLAADEKSLQLRSNETKIADLKAKLNSATSNREFDIIKSQIEADTMANSVLEDEILEALEKVDRTQKAIADAQAECDAALEQEKKVAADVAEREPQLRGQADAVRGELEVAERVIPASTMPNYRRLVQAHGAGALASVENKACTACFALLSPQQMIELRGESPVFCRTCGRLLYLA